MCKYIVSSCVFLKMHKKARKETNISLLCVQKNWTGPKERAKKEKSRIENDSRSVKFLWRDKNELTKKKKKSF